jgi:hypothetical protein
VRDSADLTARLRVAWDEHESTLFVVIDVIDDDVVSISGTSPWNAQDECELYFDIEHGFKASAARQHVVRGPWDTTAGEGSVRAGWVRHDHDDGEHIGKRHQMQQRAPRTLAIGKARYDGRGVDQLQGATVTAQHVRNRMNR